jgi:hypothetical protein
MVTLQSVSDRISHAHWRIDPCTCTIRRWMREYKQKSVPIWVLVD